MDASAKFYSLQLPGQSFIKVPPSSTVEVKQDPAARKTFFVRNDRVLGIYEAAKGSWSQVYKDENFFSVFNDDINYSWAVYEGGLLAVRKTKGFVMYKWDKRTLKQLLVSPKFHDEYGYGLQNNTVIFGKIYPSEQYVGIVSRLNSTVEFGSIKPSEPGKPVRALKKRLNLDPEWTLPSSSISLVERYDNKTQLSIAVRTASKLKLFRFNEKYALKELATVNGFLPFDRDYDRIMFAKFDNGSVNDLLLFTTKGLTMYRLDDESGRFRKVYHTTMFSKLRGWNKRTIETIATVDIDGDNRDELIASGPKGLCVYRSVFTDEGFDLVNIFDETLEDRVVRYGLPKLTTKAVKSEGSKILLYTGDHLLEVRTKPFAPQTHDIPPAQSTIAKPKPNVPLLVPQKRYIVWLHDQLDLHSMLQPLNPHAGTVELSIPLIELPNAFGVSVRKFLQYKNIPFESFFGRGWSLPLDYISVERKNSGFLQDHDYAILKNNNRIILKRRPAWDSLEHWTFVIEGYKQARIKYFPNVERWEFTMEDRTFVYGRWGNLSMMRQESVCSTWPLCGRKSEREKKLPSRWYLVHEETKRGSYANYYYDKFVTGKGDRLARIELDSGSSVRLQYSDTHQLQSFTVNTTCYEQNVSFEYEGNSLKQIKQENRTLFKFDYKDQRMSRIVYPNQLESTLEYSDMEIDRTRFEELVPVDISPTMYYGPDYTVILDKEYEDDRLVISFRNLLGGTDGPKAIKGKLHFGQPGIKSHTIHALEDMLVVVLLYSSQKEVTILQFTNNDWVEKEYHADFPLDGTISVGKKFVVVYNLKSVRVLTIGLDGKLTNTEIKKSVPRDFLIHTFANGFVMYDPTDITIWTMGLKNQWKRTYTSPPTNLFADIETVLDVFVLEAEFRTALRKGFLADAVTVYQNAIVLRAPAVADKTLELKVYFLILNVTDGPRFVSNQSARIPIANFNTYEYDMPTKDGDVFKLYYVKQNQKLILKLKSMRGPLYASLMEQRQKSYKQIDASKESAAKKKQYKMEVDQKIAEEQENISKTVISKVQFAMDLSQFGVLMNQQGVVTGNVQLSFDGQTWLKQPISPETMRMEKVNQSLGDGFKLRKNNYEDTFKVYEMPQDVMVYDSHTNNPQEIQIVAPRYIQSQPAGKPLSMFFFPTKETVQLHANETMVRASNTIALVTVRHVNETSKFVIFRPVDSFLLKQTTLFTKQTVQLGQNETRTSTHIYNAQDAHLSSEGAMFYRVKVAPGSNTHRFGWYEQTINATTGKTTKKSFASDGTDVTVRVKQKRERAETRDLEGTIWDKNQQQKIVDLGALKLADEVASYYGFEPYELNHYGVDNKWIFDEKYIQMEQENHYLQLPAGSTLKASFTPIQSKNIWIVSFWVRLKQVPKVDPKTELKIVSVHVVDLRNNSRQTVMGAKVQHITSDWCYVEMTVDTSKHADGSKLRFDVCIKPDDSQPSIDVDHVRFSPLDLNFLANVYTPVNAEVRATLHNNGKLKQSLYGPNGRRVALLSQDGQVIDFAMHSKTAYVASVNARQCLMEMKPNLGMYETFDTTLWQPKGTTDWSISYGELQYNPRATRKRGEIVRKFDLPFESLALRFLYNYFSDDTKLEFSWNGQQFVVICSTELSCSRPPKAGEVLIFITELRVSVWVEGHLQQEALLNPNPKTANKNEFRLLPTGSTRISEFLAMYDARVKVTYYNRMGRPKQLIVYNDPSTVRLRELVYDEIDRPIMQTKWTKLTYNAKEYFAFNENFITQVHGTSHVMSGTVSRAHPSCGGFPYSRTVYANDPTENKQFQGLPGKDYSVLGKYKRRYAMRTEITLLAILFPEADGFRQKIVERPGGAIRATVEDKRGNKVAKFWQVGNFEHRLTTYEYSDTYGHLLQVLPPQYHALAKTTSRMRPLLTGENTLEESQLRSKWRTSYYYGDINLIGKHVPDGGNFEYVYTESGILRFAIHYTLPHRQGLDRVVHFTYSSLGKVMREALVNLTREQCYKLVETNEVPESDNAIETFYGEIETNPDVRYRSQQSTRRIGNTQMMESLIFDENEKVIKKVFVVPTINNTFSIDYEYENGKLHSLQYPMNSTSSSFTLIYEYNGSGEVKSVRESSKRDPFFEFTYNADGMMETMKVRTDAKHMFQRNFTYNEPGFLVKLEDEYLSESVSYLETDSYGQDSYTPIYEGLISRTLFTAHWQKSAGSLRNGIYPEFFITDNMDRKRAALCNEMLRRTGYIDKNNFVTKTFYGELDDDLPFVCVKRIAMKHLSGVLSSKSFPYQYGHRYDYDDHDQLIKAKYVHGLDELALSPLTRRTFSKEIEGIDEATSKKIWDALRTKSFLTMDCTNPNLCHGREGTKSIFSDFIRLHRHSYHLKTMLSKAISKRKALNLKEFEQKCKRWIEGSSMTMKMCSNLQQTLSSENIIGDNPTNPLSSLHAEFRKALKRYERYIPDVVGVLTHHFATALGRSAADVQSYEIDANGNHRKFYTGFTRYRLEYRPGTNQISKLYRQQFDRVQRAQEQFSMAHDSDGAVIQAEHKGIKHMEYDKLLHRVSKIEMMDERKLIYQYDVRGERTFKQVLDKDGRVTSEKYYIRDANGLVLMDMDMTYLADDKPPDVRVTSYIYKDQQLIGFLRNDKLYAVITDHEGSVRLVVKDGEVIAAYDYLPYGQIFRRFGTDYDGQLSYLYTGQEWEPETGLYNYRARLYDPDIGRFYQMDPKEQYPSPYVYAGNSPVALIDPDGELAFAISCIIMAIIGAYIGAASAAKSWNPLEWNWKSKSLWLGIICGALTGLSIPYNMTASIAYFVGMGLSLSASIGVMIGSGITFGYFALAASSGSWDPRNFDFSSPGTWNALLGGIATSAFIVTSPNSLISTFRSITTTLGRALFVVSTVSITVSFAYLFGALKMGGEFDVRKWDFTDPGLYYSIIDAYVTASFVTVTARNLPGTIKKFGKKIETGLDRLAETEIYFRAKQLMRGDWSSKLANARFFLAANAQAIGNLQRGIIPIAFYTFFVSLRMADSYEKSAIPGFSVFLQIIQTAFMTKGFTNRVVKPLMPSRVNTPLAQRLEAVPSHDDHTDHASSAADCLRSIFHTLHIPFEWLFSHAEHTHYREYPSSNTIDNYSAHYRPTTKHSTIENCHAMTHGKGDVRYYVNCYSHRSFVTIHPKDDAVLEAHDNYRHCLPLTYNGVPAISCDGHRSTLLAVQLEPPKMFAYVDGWLLLARVAPAALREAKRIFQSLFARESNVAGVLKETLEKRISVRESMQKTILDLQTLCKKTVSNGWNMSWFNSMLSDLEEDVHEYCCYGRGNGSILLERLAALYSDAKEEIELRESSKILSDIPAVNANTQNVCDLGFFLGSSDTNTCYTGSTDLSLSSV